MEELSRVKEKLEAGEMRGFSATEQQENRHVVGAIRKLDKETLNVYTPLRTGLGTKEPSWTGLVLSGLGSKHRIEGMEAVRDEQDHRN
jgi:hypothetical protein